jgi:hypothetical protein
MVAEHSSTHVCDLAIDATNWQAYDMCSLALVIYKHVGDNAMPVGREPKLAHAPILCDSTYL